MSQMYCLHNKISYIYYVYIHTDLHKQCATVVTIVAVYLHICSMHHVIDFILVKVLDSCREKEPGDYYHGIHNVTPDELVQN